MAGAFLSATPARLPTVSYVAASPTRPGTAPRRPGARDGPRAVARAGRPEASYARPRLHTYPAGVGSVRWMGRSVALVVALVLLVAGAAPEVGAARVPGPPLSPGRVIRPAEPPPAPPDLAPHAAAAVLMDASSGRIVWEKNEHERRPVASITKLMTMALVLDAIRAGKIHWNEMVTAGEEAWRTGGSQIWLEVGEMMSVKQLFTAVAVTSANDAAVALAEYVGGSTAGFVEQMNRQAARLGMKDTVYRNPHGLDEEGHVSSAYDVALISRYLVTRDPEVLKFTSIFDTRLRENVPGKSSLWLVSTNKVCLRAYPGCDGLKTGWTTSAGYGVSMTAKRGTTRLIAVVLGEPTSKERNADAFSMLNYGFSHFVTALVAPAGKAVANVPVDLGVARSVPIGPRTDAALTVEKGQEKTVGQVLEIPRRLAAPLAKGQSVGAIVITQGRRPVARVDLVTLAAVPRAGLWRIFLRLLHDTWPWRA